MRINFLLTIGLSALLRITAFCQTPYTPASLSIDDYAMAEKSLSYHVNDLIYHDKISAYWSDHFLIYETNGPAGYEYHRIELRNGKKSLLFNRTKLLNGLSSLLNIPNAVSNIRLRNLKLFDGQLTFSYGNTTVRYDLKSNAFEKISSKEINPIKDAFVSPDQSKAVFIQGHNLWVQDLISGNTKQLTTDGIEHYGYGTNNAGWTKKKKPVLIWSPDSKKIASFRHDARGVGEMHMVSTQVGHPELQSWKYPLPGDSLIFRIERLVIDVESGEIVRFQMPPDMHRSSVTDHIALRDGTLADVMWSDDSKSLAFVSSSRDHKEATLRVADIRSGEIRDVIHEIEDTFFESGYRQSNWQYLPESNEVIWYSQKSNWGHLYLYDLTTGQLKHRITQGDWNVTQVKHVDKEARVIYFYGVGKEEGDPYYQYLYRVQLDGSDLQLLTPENANHQITFSPGHHFFTDNFSTPQRPQQSVLRNNVGKKIADLEQADITKLVETGWQAPMNIKVKARDDKTDLYGLLFKPKEFDPNKKYPILNYIYPGPQTGSVRGRNFSAARRDHQALADLGFIVVAIDGMGTPLRSKSFHEAYYGNMGDNGLPDQVTGMKQLAAKYPWIDLDRAGIFGHSGGGFASTAAMFRYPDFFKVAVSGAGNHDNRSYEDDWGEKWQGLLIQNEDGTTNYDNQANQLVVDNLKGKLMLTHGTMDGNVPVYNTLLVADRLIEANKDFDLVLFPNRGHGFYSEPYMMRKRWDYFVEHLLGATPPKEFKFKRRVKP